MSDRAELIEDGGAAASDGEQFFRSPEFLGAERVTHSLVVEGTSRLALPVIVRPIEGTDLRDASSPYGYPGASGAPDPPPDPAEIDWSATGLVSLFVRDRVGGPGCLVHGTVRSEVQIAQGDAGMRKRLREQIRSNERRGWSVRALPGPEADGAARAAFERAYGETMRRTKADDRYLYSSEYFRQVLASDAAWLLLAARDGGEAEAGAIAVHSDGYLHYYLGGTADPGLEDSPMKNLFAAMISLADGRGMALNLGGGVRPGDSLESFKRGFATGTVPFRTHEVVCDRPAYEELSAGAGDPAGGFFPAYRA